MLVPFVGCTLFSVDEYHLFRFVSVCKFSLLVLFVDFEGFGEVSIAGVLLHSFAETCLRDQCQLFLVLLHFGAKCIRLQLECLLDICIHGCFCS